MKKRMTKILTFASMFLLLASCGGGDTGGGGGGGGGTARKVEVNFWHTFGQTIVDNLKPQIEQFKKLIKANDNVEVVVNLVGKSDYKTILEQINKGINTGDIPTLAVCYPDHVAEYLYAEGNDEGKYVVNLDPYINSKTYGLGTEKFLGDIEGDSESHFVPAYIDEGKHFVREGTYTFPYMKSSEAMIYNLDAVTTVLSHYKPEFQGNLVEIKNYMNNLTWEEFMNLCRETLKYKAEINKDMVRPAFYDSDSNLFISQLYQAGIGYSSVVPSVSDPNKKTGHIDFADGENRTKAEQLVTNLKGWFDEGLFTTKGVYSTYGSDSFKNKESVFTIGSTGGSGYNLTTEFSIGVCKVPVLNPDNPLFVCQGPDLCVFNKPGLNERANNDRVLYAWKLIKYLTNAENNAKLCVTGSEGYLPVRNEAYYTKIYLDFLATEASDPKVTIAKTVTNKASEGGIDGRYLTTPCFMGSSELRTQCGGIITMSLAPGEGEPTTITDVFNEAINAATQKIK